MGIGRFGLVCQLGDFYHLHASIAEQFITLTIRDEQAGSRQAMTTRGIFTSRISWVQDRGLDFR
jgi:hypothetical protein